MGVDVAQGSPFEFVSTTQTLNGSTGRTFQVNNIGWICLASMFATLVTTATAGSRNPLLEIFDSAGNEIAQIPFVTSVAASTTERLAVSAGLPFISQTNTMYGSSPYPLMLPPGAQVKWLDPSNIDVNDTIQFNAVFTQ